MTAFHQKPIKNKILEITHIDFKVMKYLHVIQHSQDLHTVKYYKDELNKVVKKVYHLKNSTLKTFFSSQIDA